VLTYAQETALSEKSQHNKLNVTLPALSCLLTADRFDSITNAIEFNPNNNGAAVADIKRSRRCFNAIFSWRFSEADPRDRSNTLMSTTILRFSSNEMSDSLKITIDALDALSALAMDYRLAAHPSKAGKLQVQVVETLRSLVRNETLANREISLVNAALLIAENRLNLFLIESGEWTKTAQRIEQIEQAGFAKNLPASILAEYYDIKGQLAAQYGQWANAAVQHRLSMDTIEARFAELPKYLQKPYSEYINNLAVAKLFNSEFAEAEAWMDKAYRQRLNIYEPDHPIIAESFYNLAGLHRQMDRPEKASQHLESALNIQRRWFDESHLIIVTTLNDLALTYAELGHSELSKDLLAQSCHSAKTARGQESLTYSTCLHNQAYLESVEGQYGKAIKLERKSLALRQRLLPDTHPAVAASLNSLGLLLGAVGQYQSQHQFLSDAHQIRFQLFGQPHALTASSIHNLGFAKVALGELEDARDLFTTSLEDRLELLSPKHGDVALNQANLAFVLLLLGEPDRAQQFVDAAMTTFSTSRSHQGIRLAHLHSINGQIAGANGDVHKAEIEYITALALVPDVAYSGLQSHIEYHLAQSLEQRGLRPEAIAILKRSVSRLVEVRDALTSDMQLSFISSNQQLFRLLVSWLLAEDRIAEADNVLDLLDQYNNDLMLQVRGDNNLLDLSSEEIQHTNWLDSIILKVENLGEGQSAAQNISEIWHRLRGRKQKKKRNHDTSCRMANIQTSVSAEPNNSTDALVHDRHDQTNVARLRYTVSPSSIELMVRTADATHVCTSTVELAELAGEISQFREAILQSQGNWTPNAAKLSRTLYSRLLGPADPILRDAGVTALLVDLDSVMGFVPFAALHDGSVFVAQRYTLSRTTERLGLALPKLGSLRMAGFGLSEPHRILRGAPLPWVRVELNDIVSEHATDPGTIPGDVFLDDEFTPIRYSSAVEDNVPILHITGHFELDHDELSKSYFHAGNGDYLFYDQLIEPRKSRQNALEQVSLLALPSCQTALQPGDIRQFVDRLGAKEKLLEVESMAAGAMRAGANSVLASLWDVNDASTAALTNRLYNHLADGLSVSSALQLTQAEFINGDINCKDQLAVALSNHSGDPMLASVIETDVSPEQYCSANWSSPYYWAGLVLFGGENL